MINGQPTRVLVEWDGGQGPYDISRQEFPDVDEPFNNDELPCTELKFDQGIQTQYLKLTILEATEGTKYKDIAISEIEVFQ